MLPPQQAQFCLTFSEIDNSFHLNNPPQKSKFLYLLNLSFDLFQYIPRLFTITTNNGSYKFNTEMLLDTSATISNYLALNPDQFQYHLDINDEENIMNKFEQLYIGKPILFNNSEIPLVSTIIQKLDISNIPDFLKPNQMRQFYGRYHSAGRKSNGVQLNKLSFEVFLKKKVPKNFIIITNNKEYHCNTFGVYSSRVIRNELQAEPSTNQYVYDFDNEFNEFNSIFHFFNFEMIQITSSNMNSLKKIAEDLEIECIYDEINDFIESYEKSAKVIEEKHEIIDEINEIFKALYDIKKLTVKTVSEVINESVFSHGEENVQELAAFLLQVVRSDFSLHFEISELLFYLKENADDQNELNLLFPFFVKELMLSFTDNRFQCSFVYLMYKRGVISKEEIVDKIFSSDNLLSEKMFRYGPIDDLDKQIHNNVVVWFFPELLESKKVQKDKIFTNLNNEELFFVNFYYPNNIDGYKRIRDRYEPDDEVTLTLIKDDVDTFQSILNQKKINVNEKVPFNIFESFVNFENSTYLNYAASYGSIKCFKYLLLNHAKIDQSTLPCAVYGGNSEIIRIIDQSDSKSDILIDNEDEERLVFGGSLIQAANFAIMKHRDDLFDWILEQKLTSQGVTGNSLSHLATISVENGNIHSLIECIDTGLDLSSFSRDFCEKIIQNSSEKGFARLTEFLFSLMKNKIKQLEECDHEHFLARKLDCSVSFGNLSIFKLFLSFSKKKQSDFEKPFLVSIERDYMSIVKYIVETLFKDSIYLSRGGILRALGQSIKKNSTDLFTYFITQFNLDNLMKKFEISTVDFYNFVLDGSSSGNYEAVKVITDLILQKNSKIDFTEPFIRACFSKSFEICHFFVEKKVFLNFIHLCKEASRVTVCDEKTFDLLFNICDSEMKEMFLGCFFYEAIKNKNKSLIDFMLKKEVSYDCALFEAVQTHDIDIVNMILENDSKPSFVNRICKNGTALNIAVCNNDIQIVRRLLSVPGINPSLYESNGFTPLISAVSCSSDIEILNELLQFYGDDIQFQSWQIYNALKIIMKNYLSVIDHRSGRFGYDGYKKKEQNQPRDKFFDIINRLLQLKTVNFNHPIDKNTLLTFACEINENELVQMILKYDKIDVNSYELDYGNTPLMIAVENNNIELVELLIGIPQTDINMRNFLQQTPLTIAVKKKREKVVPLLVDNERFDPVESRLNYAFFESSGQISSQLISVEGLDVNYKLEGTVEKYQEINSNNDGYYGYYLSKYQTKRPIEKVSVFETTLIHAVSTNDVEMVDMIINHSSFDPVKSQLKTAIFISAQKNLGEIFKKLLKLIDDDVNVICQNGQSLLITAVRSESQEIVTRIVNHSNFNPVKSELFQAFLIASYIDEETEVAESSEAMINIMNILCKYDSENGKLIRFDNLLPNGKSYFTSIDGNLKNLQELVAFFLDHNVDVNAPDTNGVYPLEYAIGINSFNFVKTLIKSRKVDFSKRLNQKSSSFMGGNNQTYLHLAAICKDNNILSELLKLNLIDINSIDDLGETPLMEACKYNRIGNIRELFFMDDLDYLYCNYEGEDAIKIARKCSNSFFFGKRSCNREDGQIRTKDEYLDRLISIINETISNLGK